MNILVDLLPKKVDIDVKYYEINWYFRTSILFEMMMDDVELSDEEKLIKGIELYYPVIPENLEEAIEKIIWFYSCGKETNNESGTVSNSKNDKIYSLEYDDEYIYSAFLSQYGIDLQDIEDLHWWKFKAMFKSLNEENQIVKIMGYRAMDIPNDMPNDQKDFYRKMKKLYELPRSKSEIEKVREIENALLGNGDLSKVL